MNISEVFIRRPVATTLLMAAIIFAGVFAYVKLPVSHLPNVDFPTISVSASLPGASPETMAATVATPLEREFSTIAGVESMTSSSSAGSMQITLQFNLDRDIDGAAQDVQAMITKAARRLPAELPAPPSFSKVNPADTPVFYLSLSSPVMTLSSVNEYADKFVAQRISMLPGVAQVQVYGSQKYAVRARVDPEILAARGIGIDEVAAAIQKSNVTMPTGALYGRFQAFTVKASGALSNAGSFRPLIVAYRNGAPVRLGELGEVADSVENDKIASWNKDTRAIVLAILRQPGTNTVEIVDSIKALFPVFRGQLPAALDLNIIYDRSESIRDSVNDVKMTLLIAITLVVLVIFMFLRNLSATVIPSLALPVSIIGTFAVMYPLDYSVDNLSLMALILAVGFVVDDAIVMLENIVRHMERGEEPYQAALNGSREIGFTILSMTLSLVAVFIPVLFMGGIMGRLLNEFAVTISVAILVSGVVSLTLTPMLCSRFLRGGKQERHGALFNLFERMFARWLNLYERSLKVVLNRRKATMAFTLAMLAAVIIMFVKMPSGFLPSEDTGQLFAFTEAEQGIGFDEMARRQRTLADIVKQDPNIDTFMSSIGSGGPNSSMNTGRMFIRLKPRSQRKLGADDVIKELREKTAGVSGIRMFMQNLPPIRIGGTLTKSQYQFTLQSPDIESLYVNSAALEDKLRAAPGLQDVTSDMQIKNPEVNVAIDRDMAASLGVSPAKIEEALGYAYSSSQVSTIYGADNQYKMILEVAPDHQENAEMLQQLRVRSASGALVQIAAVAKISRSAGPMSVNHLGQFPSVTLSFNLKPGVALSDAVKTVDRIAWETLPGSITTSFQGAAQAFQASQKGLFALLVMAILVIYVVLGILYESFLHPITILSGLPSAGFGALATLMAFGMELNLYSFVGVIMLVGIVKKNAIMMIDFALSAQRNEGKPPLEAIFQGCMIRFRPIMMTTMAALMGTLPIALGLGASAEARRPLGLAVVGGLLFSQLITLYVTPVFYLYMEAFREKVGKMR
ncbi:MAG: efflux RND transporter permease subunit [Nitrospinae bacterium]|nr:efflux RND transporter permease subunit [Nitrospinota bacterium]